MSGRSIGHSLTTCIGLFLVLGAELSAQQEPSQETAAEPTPERIIYLPFEDLDDVLDQQNSSVIIPYPEYIRLWSKAEGTREAGTRVDAVITQADYTATIEADVARIRADLVVFVVGKPWVEVPLDFGEAAVGSVTSETGDVLLRGTGDGTYALLLKEQGEQRVTLELTTRVVTSPDGREISFATPTVAVTTLELSVPQADQAIEIHPRLVQLPVESEEAITQVKASLGATGKITAKWYARASAKPQMELLASVTNLQKVNIADGLIHADATLKYNILRGELEQVRIAVPTGHRVLDVTASTRIRRWQSTEEDNRQLVVVDLLTPATDTLTVDVHTEVKQSEGALVVAGIDDSGQTNGIHALDVVRESGQLVVAHGDDLTLRVTDQSGLVRIEAEEVAESIRQARSLAYKFFNPEFVLQVMASPVEPRVHVDHAAQVEIREDQVHIDSALNYTVMRAGIFELRIGIPDGLEVTRVDSEQMEEFRIDDDTLIISLRQRMTGAVAVVVAGEQELPGDGEQFDLPLLEPLNVERERGTMRLLARDSVEVTTNADEVESALPDTLGGRPSQKESALRASWRFNRRPVRIPITVTRKPTRLSAQVATDVDVQPTRTRITTTVDFLVEYAGLDTFRVDVPEAAMPTLQIEPVASGPTSPALRETTIADPVEGWVTHTLTMQRPVTGRQRFRLTYDLQPTPDDPAAPRAGGAGGVDANDAAGADAPANDADADGDAAANSDDAATPDVDGSSPADNADQTDKPTDAQLTPADGTTQHSDPESVDPDGTTDADQATDDAGADSESDDEEETAAPDVARLETSIWIIRPLGTAADDDDATDLSHVTGEVRLDKEESLTITASATGADIEPIDVRELQTLPQQGTLAYRYRQHPADETIMVTISQARYDVQEMIATVVSRALVEIMLGDDPTATYRCRYRIKSTERQRLELRMPKGVDLLSVLVDNSEVRLEPIDLESDRNWDRYYVKVSRSGESDEPFSLSLQFLLSFSEPPFEAGFLRGRLAAQLPIVGRDDGSAAIQELRTVIWVPDDYALIGNPSGFTLGGQTVLLSALVGSPKRVPSPHDDDEWIGSSSAGELDFPTSGRVAYHYTNLGGQSVIKPLWWDTLWVTVVVSCTLVAIAIVLVRTDWENKLGILLLILFGAVLLGLKDIHVLAHALSAMRIGLAGMIGLWFIHALLGQRSGTGQAATAGTASAGVTSAMPPHAATVPPPGVFEHFLSSKSRSDDDLG